MPSSKKPRAQRPAAKKATKRPAAGKSRQPTARKTTKSAAKRAAAPAAKRPPTSAAKKTTAKSAAQGLARAAQGLDPALRAQLISLVDQPARLKAFLDLRYPFIVGPRVESFAPLAGQPGTMLSIRGQNFAAAKGDNTVTVGGVPAFVVEAEPTRLTVLTSAAVRPGAVEVRVGDHTAAGPYDFEVLPYPRAGSGEDGPPVVFEGRGAGAMGDVPPTGTARVLVVLTNPTDVVPANPAAARQTVEDAWNNVSTFYNQASYGALDVQITLTANWHTLTGTRDDYVDDPIINIDNAMKGRFVAESAQAAVDEGLDLDDFDMMACVIFLDGDFIRAWGGWSQQNFKADIDADGDGVIDKQIDLTADHDVSLLLIQESADWGRCAHEFGHNLVSSPSFPPGTIGTATLGEDIYRSDVIDPDTASTAALFDMMGSHDVNHPLFSGYHLDALGWYKHTDNASTTKVLDLQWDLNPKDEVFEVVAHGETQNTVAGRYHLIKLAVAPGLHYFIQVRQRPGATAQIFDPQIPLNGAPNQGGVIVTAALSETMNNNQQMRFITLLHDEVVLKKGESTGDPARTIKITVEDDNVVARPLVCKVRVQWAQNVADDPAGLFDLRVDPWDAAYQTPDIWVDRQPFGTFDQPSDAEGRPQGNGDKPQPNAVNQFFTRVHCDGAAGASNVPVTFYAVHPPGVGDNGNWVPIESRTIASISAGGHFDISTNWVPVVGEHTCLKVSVGQQLGEITGGNNSAQENVFEFDAPAASVPAPVVMPVAVRNPLKEPTLVTISVGGVAEGFRVHFPHSWLWLGPLEERRLKLTIIPLLDLGRYTHKNRKGPHTSVRVSGHVPRQYREELKPGFMPASRMLPIGGVTARVTAKKRVVLRLSEDRKNSTQTKIALAGAVSPGLAGVRVAVHLTGPGRAKHNEPARVVEATTNAQGQFTAAFNLLLRKLPPGVKLDPKGAAGKEDARVGTAAPVGLLTGRPPVPTGGAPTRVLRSTLYRAQAFIINSPHAAEAESEVIVIKR